MRETYDHYWHAFMRSYALAFVALLGASLLWSSSANAWWFNSKKKAAKQTPQTVSETVTALTGKPAEALLPMLSPTNTYQPYVDVAKLVDSPQSGSLTSTDQSAISRYLGQAASVVSTVSNETESSRFLPNSKRPEGRLAIKVDGVPVRVPVFSRPNVSISQPSGSGASPQIAMTPAVKAPSTASTSEEAQNYLVFGNTSDQHILNFIAQQNKRLSYQQAREISMGIAEMSRSFAIDPQLLTSVVAVESSFNPYAISTSGAVGLGQLKPSTAQWLGVTDPFDPRQNLFGTAKYLRFLLSKYNGSQEHALAAYYKGQGTIDRQGIDSDAKYYIGKVNRMRSLL